MAKILFFGIFERPATKNIFSSFKFSAKSFFFSFLIFTALKMNLTNWFFALLCWLRLIQLIFKLSSICDGNSIKCFDEGISGKQHVHRQCTQTIEDNFLWPTHKTIKSFICVSKALYYFVINTRRSFVTRKFQLILRRRSSSGRRKVDVNYHTHDSQELHNIAILPLAPAPVWINKLRRAILFHDSFSDFDDIESQHTP